MMSISDRIKKLRASAQEAEGFCAEMMALGDRDAAKAFKQTADSYWDEAAELELTRDLSRDVKRTEDR
jgi:hypothetical protein